MGAQDAHRGAAYALEKMMTARRIKGWQHDGRDDAISERPIVDLNGSQHRAARRLDAINATTRTLALVTLALLLGMGLAGWFNGIAAQ